LILKITILDEKVIRSTSFEDFTVGAMPASKLRPSGYSPRIAREGRPGRFSCRRLVRQPSARFRSGTSNEQPVHQFTRGPSLEESQLFALWVLVNRFRHEAKFPGSHPGTSFSRKNMKQKSP